MRSHLVNEMRLTIPSKSINESYARYAVSAFVGQLDPAVDELGDIRTVVSEAVTNCVVHAYREGEGKIYICVKYYDDGRVVIRIKDKGCGIPDVKKARNLFIRPTNQVNAAAWALPLWSHLPTS